MIENIVGKKFNNLLVLEHRLEGTCGHYYHCKCDCGKEKIVQRNQLLTGKTKSCGCIKSNMLKERNFIELAGKKFGRLYVVGESIFKFKNRQKRWICTCECGNEVLLPTYHLTQGWSTSCGCWNREKNRKDFYQSTKNRLYRTYKDAAKERDKEFTLSFDEFIFLTSGNCFYCGSIPKSVCRGTRAFGEYVYNGIDRVDNNKGYIIDNCVSCCKICNMMKKTLTLNEFYSYIDKITMNKHNVFKVDYQI